MTAAQCPKCFHIFDAPDSPDASVSPCPQCGTPTLVRPGRPVPADGTAAPTDVEDAASGRLRATAILLAMVAVLIGVGYYVATNLNR